MGNCICERTDITGKEIDTSPRRTKEICSNFTSNPKLFNTLLRVQARVRGMKVRDAVKVKSKRRYKSAKPSNSNQNTNSANEEKFTNYFNKNPQALHSLIRVQSICRGIFLRNQLFLKNQNGRNGVQYNGINNITTQNQQISQTELQDLFSKYTPLDDNVQVSTRPIVAFENNSVYYGEWDVATNKRHGRGIQKWPDGSKYIGYWKDNHTNGKGKLIHCDGDYYEGDWVNDRAEGQGSYYHLDGAKYEGQWKNDKQEGFGVENWPDGSSYEGHYLNGFKNGQGTFKWSDGSMYTGNFVDNVIQGKGVYIWKDGRSYDGDWVNNKMEGHGVFTWPDKKKYDGEYKNDKKEGYGYFEWADGRKYKGFWKDGKQNGEGQFYSPKNNEWREGVWENGKRIRWVTDSANA